MDLDLRPQRRDRLAADILGAFRTAVPGSAAQLKGSLAAGTADGYSDIDICWIVPDDSFGLAVGSAGTALRSVRVLTSLRVDPDLARSGRRRLIYARLAGLPLFWRIDVDIRARSVADDDRYDAGNPAASSEADWSRPASAIENSVAAVKSVMRRQPDVTEGLLRRGFERIGQDLGPARALPHLIACLADSCAAQEPALASMAAEVRELADHLIGEQETAAFRPPPAD